MSEAQPASSSTARNVFFGWLLLIALSVNLTAPLGIMALMVASPEHEGFIVYWLQVLPEYYSNPGVIFALLTCEVFTLYLADRRWKRIPVLLVLLMHLVVLGSLIMLWENEQFPYAVDHIDSTFLTDHTYQLAQFDSQGGLLNGYLLYECDPVGLICQDIFFYLANTERTDVRLYVDLVAKTVSIQIYSELVYTYQPSER